MKTVTKIISGFVSSVIMFNCFSVVTSAKVIEPEIVKTESWTTSYSVGGNVYSGDGLYGPYECKCLCDVYNDGCIYVYIQYDNLPKGDVNIYLEECVPIKSSGCFRYSSGMGRNFSVNKVFGDNFYPDYYNIEYNSFVRFDHDGTDSNKSYMFFYTEPTEYIENFGMIGSECFPYANIITDTNKPETAFKFDNRTTNTYIIKLSTYSDVTTNSEFRLFGHDITITPEMLSGDAVPTSVKTENDLLIEQIEKLKTENEKLKKDIESLTNKVADVDNDGTITIADALTTLQYYTRNTLLGENITWEELLNKS